MDIGVHEDTPSFWSDFNEKFNFLDKLSKNTQISNLIKMVPVGADCFMRTDMTKSVFCNFAKAPSNTQDNS